MASKTAARKEVARRHMDVAGQIEVALIWEKQPNTVVLEYYKDGNLFETAPIPQGMSALEAFHHATLALNYDPWEVN